jgi:hypothetical protein
MTTDRILTGLVAAYFAYRLWLGLGLGEGVIYGDGDMNVHADELPTGFVRTALSVVLLIAVLTCIVVGFEAAQLAALAHAE